MISDKVFKKACDYMRIWAKTRLGLILAESGDFRCIDENYFHVQIKAENVGRNLVLAEFMKTVHFSFRLRKNEAGTTIWAISVEFQFKDGGRNAWTHPKTIVLKSGNFIEKD